MVVAQAQVSSQLSATAFTVERDESVPADGTERKVLLTTKQLDAKLQEVVVPRVDPRAWLVGKVQNTAEFPLLAGQAGVFLDGAYLGDFTMQTVAPGDDFDVDFGVDDHLTVKRVGRDIETGRTSVVGKRARAHWVWDVHVRNGHKRAVHVLVKEQVPLTSRSDVAVSMLGTPSPAPKIGDQGMLDFPLDLQAGQEGVVSWGYQVEYPADLSLGWLE
jgi:uncharacterized protein (TIGR02231 family)